jgi:parvulin-like peptidyl-prolyl isomerase
MISALLIGCENIPFLSPKRPALKKTEPVAAPLVRGALIATINNLPVTLEDLDGDIENYNAMVPDDKPELRITTREQKVNYLKNELVKRILLYQYAMSNGLDKKEEIQRILEKTKMDLLVVELVREEAAKIDVTAKEIEDYYNSYKEELKEPEEKRIREIVTAAEQDARNILIQLLQGADFAASARERSISASAKEGGDLGFVARGKKSAQFDAVAFSDTLEVGGVSNIFKGPDGYYILKLEEKRGGKQKSLSEMWDDIKRVLMFLKQQQRVDELIAKLSREAKLEIYEGAVK